MNRLGVTGSPLRTPGSTDPIESMIEIVRDHATRVKHWESGEMALRWAARRHARRAGPVPAASGASGELPLLAAARSGRL